MNSDSSNTRTMRQVARRVTPYVKPHLVILVAALLCMVVFGATDGAVPLLLKQILDGIFADKRSDLLYIIPAALFLFALLRGAADFGQQFLMARVGHELVNGLRRDFHRSLLLQGHDFFAFRSGADLITRLSQDTLTLKNAVTDALSSIIRDTIRLIALLSAALYLDWKLALIGAIVFPIAIYPIVRFGKRMRKLSRVGQETTGKLSSVLHEGITGSKVIKVFGQEDRESARFEVVNRDVTKTYMKAERIHALVGPLNEVLATIAIGGVILYGGVSVLQGLRTQGEFLAFLASLFLMYEPFKKLSRVYNQVQLGVSAAERLFEVIDSKPSIQNPASPVALPASRSLEFKDVSVQYPRIGGSENISEAPFAVSDISLTIQAGERVAFVGLSGAGKSTLLDLVPRFLDPTSGSILLGSVDIRSLSISDLRSQIAYVGQHVFLFHDTIRNNISYAKPDATDAELHAAAEASALTFIENLEAGFETQLGEGGMTLSGGERQRLAIARAVLKNAPILILDEATASLDAQSERIVQQALDALSENRTTLVIAHRLSTIMNADRVIVMKSGSIVEQGSPAALLEQQGEFRKLYDLQFGANSTSVEAVTVNL